MKLYELLEDEKRFILILELLEGKDLLDYVTNQPQAHITEKLVAGLMKQILLGLNYCHLEKLAHRDIKPENIMFADKACKQLKLVDFGFAKILKESGEKYQTALGTPMYMAPEVVKRCPYDNKCDIWSAGIVCFVLLSGLIPYELDEDASIDAVIAAIKDKRFSWKDFDRPEFKDISESAKKFILKMLCSEPEDRASASELLTDPWLVNAKDEQVNPEAVKKSLQNISMYKGQQMFQKTVMQYLSYRSDLSNETDNLTKMFERMDKDGSQTLSKDELKKGLSEGGMTLSEKELDKLFIEVDKDCSGAINYSEFVTAFMDRSMLLTEKKLELAFKFFDKDGNGIIDKEEVMTAIKTGWISDVQLAESFKVADTNGDSKVILCFIRRVISQ